MIAFGEQEKDIVYHCIRCGLCLSFCPVYRSLKIETYAPRAKMQLVKALLADRLETSRSLDEVASHCLLCLSCAAQCPGGVPTHRIILALRMKMVEDHGLDWKKRLVFHQILGKPGRLTLAARWARVIHNQLTRRLPVEFRAGTLPLQAIPPIGRPLHFQYPEMIPPRGRTRGRVAFFPGCATSFVLDDIGRAVIHVLTQCGFEVILPRDPMCCGAPMFLTGEHRVSLGNIEHTIHTLLQPGVEVVITCCATCGSALRREYPEIVEKLGGDAKAAGALAAKTRDIMEFMAEQGLKDVELKAVPVLTTYHHPCHLLHGQGVRDAPKQVLEQIPGLEWVEMEEADFCCGGGGSFQLYFPETSEKIVEPKIDHILESGAQTVATGCPGCIIQIAGNLSRRASDASEPIDVIHPIQILARAMPG